MAGRAAKCIVGIQDNDQNTYKRNTLSASVQERGRYPY